MKMILSKLNGILTSAFLLQRHQDIVILVAANLFNISTASCVRTYAPVTGRDVNAAAISIDAKAKD